METVNGLTVSAPLIFFYMTVGFLVGLLKRDNSIVDVMWGFGFILVALVTYLFMSQGLPRQVLVTLMILVWGIRLGTHIFLRNKGKGEDFRYKKWREDWGHNFVLRSFLQVYLLQGVLLLMISSPAVLVNTQSGPGLNLLDFLGFLVWLFGFSFETVADLQLQKFIKNPKNKGKILTSGLWRFSRHPNYFGEAVLWWGLFLIALSVPLGFYAIISPLLITFLLLKVSGVALLEKKYGGNRAYRAYQKRTSAFVPWFPKETKL